MGGEVETKRRGEGDKEALPVVLGPSEAETRRRQGDDVTAESVVFGGDTSRNRHGEPEHELTPEMVREIGDFIGEAMNAKKMPQVSIAGVVNRLRHAKNLGDVEDALAGYFSKSTIAEFSGKFLKTIGLKKLPRGLERAAPTVAVVEAGIAALNFTLEHTIIRANLEGRERGQLNRYAAAWAGRFMEDDFEVEVLAALDDDLQLMNTCSRIGVEDALKTIEKLSGNIAQIRRELVGHYGGLHGAREALVLELLRQSGAVR